MSERENLMTLAEWGKRLGVSPVTAWRRFRDGEVEAVNIGSVRRPMLRVTEEAHVEYLRRRKIPARGRAA